MKKILLITLLAIGFNSFSQLEEKIQTIVIKKYNEDTKEYDFISSKKVDGKIFIDGNKVLMNVDKNPTYFEINLTEKGDGYNAYITSSNMLFMVYNNKVILADVESGNAVILYFDTYRVNK